MSQTEVMFFFDTEDFVAEKSSDAAKKLAEICTEEGVTGHFAVVGLLAKKLAEDGREDVIRALNCHEVGTHTYGHSIHPNICEMADIGDFNEAYRRVALSEEQGIEYIRKAFGREQLLFAVPPGNSKCYAAMYYYADAGIPFYCDTVVTDERNSDVHCANAMHIAYTESVETIAFGGGRSLDDRLEDYAKMHRVIIYTHPNMAYFRDFWDSVNFRGANLHAEGEYVMPEMRTEEESAHYFDTFRAIIRKIKEDKRFRVTSLREILSEQEERQPIKPSRISEIAARLRADYAPLSDVKLCLYDVFMAAAAFLKGEGSYQPSRAYGLLEAPKEIDRPVRLTAEGVREAAKGIPADGFLPSEFMVEGLAIGTGDMLYAMLAALEQGEGGFVLEPHPEMSFLNRYPQLRDMAIKNTWVHSPEFEDNYISDRLRLQAYTIR